MATCSIAVKSVETPEKDFVLVISYVESLL